MAKNPHSVGFYCRAIALKKPGSVLRPFRGAQITAAVTQEDEKLFQAVVLGPHNRGRLGGKAKAIPLATAEDKAPHIMQDWVWRGQVEEVDGDLQFVRQKDDGVFTEIVRTGALNQAEVAEIVRRGVSPRWHGVAPMQPGSAKILISGDAEGTLDFNVDSLAIVKHVSGMGSIKGFPGPMLRDTTVETPKGGAFYSGYIGRELEIHYWNGTEWTIYDVTHDANHQRDFEIYIREYLLWEKEQAEKKRAERAAKKAAKQPKPHTLPTDHPDR